ncbi:beta-ketoacyl synthase N-terminal-like domain-containing protein [Streptomyces sp. AHA2]|uniref:beta-ketoacyl synthase N-terminal-like domain-containing protein n=1 Tax=Streptomyces sp. AHA2 TaxID=3064526 RepID=UPI002FE183B8
MDEREILTRFKAGTLDRAQATLLLAGATARTPGPAPAPPERPHTAAPAAGGPSATDGRYAVVGLAGRYPLADDPHALFENLSAGRDTARCAPAERPGPSVLAPGQRGHFLDGIAQFDAEFFGLTPREGALLDPQERLLLEAAWLALEDAGCTGARLDALNGPGGAPRSVGFFIGVSSSDYALLAAEGREHGLRDMPRSSHGSLPGRLVALLRLSGPGQVVDTGVCSALTAVHLAVASLERGECAAAVAGGAELLLHPSRGGDGAGEGVGAVVLKRLDRALRDGDRVHAVVRDTFSGFGHAAPRHGADVDIPRGAGGFRLRVTRDTLARRVGDAGAALGIAGLTAALLQARHGVLAPAGRGEEPVPWQRARDEHGRDLPRAAVVEVDDGHGLTAGAVVEEFLPRPAVAPAEADGTHQLVLLSAPTPAHLVAGATRLADWLEAHGQDADAPLLARVARHLRAGRAALPCRIAVLAADVPELLTALRRFAGTGRPGANLRHADLRDGADPLHLGRAPETRDYLAALWRSGRLEQLTRLWLSGVEADWAALEGPAVAGTVVPPPSVFLRQTLWLDAVGERTG